MAQYKTGTVSVTNGSQVVTGQGTAWLTEVSAGNELTIPGDSAWYEIASIDSDEQVTLNVNYAGTTGSGLSYAITRDYSTNRNYPLPEQGDIETASLMRRALRQIDADIHALQNP